MDWMDWMERTTRRAGLFGRRGSHLAACARTRRAQLQAFREKEGITEAEMFARVRKSTDENELAQMSVSRLALPPPHSHKVSR
jgi:hypothetical protein